MAIHTYAQKKTKDIVKFNNDNLLTEKLQVTL